MNMSPITGKADLPISADPTQQKIKFYTRMFPNTTTQSQDLFKEFLGFARQLSQSPGLHCRLEMKLGDNLFIFQTESPGKFSGKRKSSSDYRRDKRRRKPPEKGMPIPGNHGVGSVAPGDPTGAQNGITFSPASSPPPCSKTVPWSRHTRCPSISPHCCAPGEVSI